MHEKPVLQPSSNPAASNNPQHNPTSPQTTHTRSRAWLVCLASGLFFFFAFIQMNMFNALGPRLMSALHLNAAQLGNLSANYFYAYVLMLFPAGIILDRCSVRRTILIAMAICILSTLLFAFVNSYHQALSCRFVTGLSAAFTFLAAIRLSVRWFKPQQLAYVVGCIVTMAMLGGTLAQTPLTLIADHYGWQHMLMLNAGLGLVLWIIISLFVRDFPPGVGAQQTQHAAPKLRHAIAQVIRNRQNWCAGLYTSLMNLPILLLGAMWGGMYLTQVNHLSRTQASLVVSLLFIGAIFGSPCIGWLSDKMGNRCRPMRWGAALSLILVLLLMYVPGLNEINLMLIFLLLGFITSAQVLSYPLVAESNPEAIVGTAEGLSAVLIMSGGFLQPLFGFIIERGWQHRMLHHVPLYGIAHYQHAMLIFPVAFGMSFLLTYLLREGAAQHNTTK